jgi:hypothetical protein
MSLTISDRRTIMNSATSQPDFRDLMHSDPRAAVARAIDRPAPADLTITVIEEQPDAWEFVIPANAIDAQLPAPGDIRTAVENDVYALLRDEPQVRAQLTRDPKAFLAERLQISVGEDRVCVREEQPGELIVVLPHAETREGLSDEMLDLAGGSGDMGKQSGQRAAPRDNIYG